MRRTGLPAIAALFAFVAAPAWAAITDSQAIDLIRKTLRQARPDLRQHCLTLVVEGRSRQSFDIAVREKHGGQCPGDPLTRPVIERFRVMRSPVRVSRYDLINDAYRPVPR